MNTNSAGRYLLYALGEILLVVVGILIALAINNSNDLKKQQAQLDGIFSAVEADLKIDTVLVGRMINFYEARETVADSITMGKFNSEDYKTCVLCGSMLTTYVPLKLNDKGYSQLKGFNQNSKTNDSLATEIVQFYNGYFALIEEIQKRIQESTYGTIEHWRDNKPWFASIMTGQPIPEFFEYMESTDFKNRIAYYNIIACKNMLPLIKSYKRNAEEVLKRVNQRLDTNSD